MSRLLLIQARMSSDLMSDHEASCIQRRLGNSPITLDRLNALAGPFNPETVRQYAGVIIGGSGQFSVHHPESRKWTASIRNALDLILKDRQPLFGLCFGHQILAYHLGIEVCTSASHSEVGTLSYNLTEAGIKDPVFSNLDSTFVCPTGHTDYVVEIPGEATLLAHNKQVLTQAFHYKAFNAYSTQFHPDLTGSEAQVRYLACCEDDPLISKEKIQEKLALFHPRDYPANDLLSAWCQRYITSQDSD